MHRKPDESLAGAFFGELGSRLLQFVLFIGVPAGAGVLAGVFSPASILLCAIVGGVLGFLAWCLWNWQTLLTGFFD